MASIFGIATPALIFSFYFASTLCALFGAPLLIYGAVAESWHAVAGGSVLLAAGLPGGYSVVTQMISGAQLNSASSKMESLLATASMLGRKDPAN